MHGQFLLLPCFYEIPVINANRVDPDQTPRSAASDLGLHYLLTSLLWDAKHKWIKYILQDLEYFVSRKKETKRSKAILYLCGDDSKCGIYGVLICFSSLHNTRPLTSSEQTTLDPREGCEDCGFSYWVSYLAKQLGLNCH